MTPTWLRAAYDREAPTYDARFHAQQAPKLRRLAAAVPPTAGVELDLGAGTGLLRRLTGRPVLQIDLSRAMLRQGAGPRVQGDLSRLPLPGDVASAVFCVTALIGPAPPRPALEEIARVLAPGGWLALSVLAHEDVQAIERALHALSFHILERLDILPDVAWVARAT